MDFGSMLLTSIREIYSGLGKEQESSLSLAYWVVFFIQTSVETFTWWAFISIRMRYLGLVLLVIYDT